MRWLYDLHMQIKLEMRLTVRTLKPLTDLEELVETVGGLLNQHLPAAVVVVAPRQSKHAHLLDQRVRANYVVAFVRILFHH